MSSRLFTVEDVYSEAASSVYFIQNTGTYRIKIGHAADVAKRVGELQTGADARLVVLGSIPGGREVEQVLHARLSRWRVSGEWFAPSVEVVTVIAELLKGLRDDVASVPLEPVVVRLPKGWQGPGFAVLSDAEKVVVIRREPADGQGVELWSSTYAGPSMSGVFRGSLEAASAWALIFVDGLGGRAETEAEIDDHVRPFLRGEVGR